MSKRAVKANRTQLFDIVAETKALAPIGHKRTLNAVPCELPGCGQFQAVKPFVHFQRYNDGRGLIVSRNALQHVGAKNMILRRFMQHVGSQNWFAVGLDVLVVIFGVYIGIYLGELASERATIADVQDALEVVRVQLEEDLRTADRIIAYRQAKLEEPKQLLLLMADGKVDSAAFGHELTGAFGQMFTFFPKTSGYAAMKDRGYLARLDDAELLEALANLYDQIYVRHGVIADEGDQNTFFYERNVIGVYWNLEDPGFIGDEAIARARIRNSLRHLESYSEWYVEFLGEILRPAIVAALKALEAQQGR